MYFKLRFDADTLNWVLEEYMNSSEARVRYEEFWGMKTMLIYMTLFKKCLKTGGGENFHYLSVVKCDRHLRNRFAMGARSITVLSI